MRPRREPRKFYISPAEAELIDRISDIESEYHDLLGAVGSHLASFSPRQSVWVDSLPGFQLGLHRESSIAYSIYVRDVASQTHSFLLSLEPDDLLQHIPYLKQLRVEVIKAGKDSYYEMEELVQCLRQFVIGIDGDEHDLPIHGE